LVDNDNKVEVEKFQGEGILRTTSVFLACFLATLAGAGERQSQQSRGNDFLSSYLSRREK
jgi:hypothetical protein